MTDEARLITTVLATPARIVYLVLLVGTTLEILAERRPPGLPTVKMEENL